MQSIETGRREATTREEHAELKGEGHAVVQDGDTEVVMVPQARMDMVLHKRADVLRREKQAKEKRRDHRKMADKSRRAQRSRSK